MRLFVEALDLFNFIVAAHEDSRSIVNVFGLDIEHAVHLAVDSLAAGYELLVEAT